jgi:hypothetical protein
MGGTLEVTMRRIVAIVLVAHGIGHTMSVMPVLIDTPANWHAGSWLLDRLLGERVSSVVGIVTGFALATTFTLAGLSLARWGVHEDWWRGLALWSGIGGLVWLLLYWNSLATLFNKLGAIAVDIGAIVIAIGYDRFYDD